MCREFTPFNSVNTYPTDFYVYVPDEPAVVVMEADDKQDMSTISHEKKYGTSADVWQVYFIIFTIIYFIIFVFLYF